MILDPEPYWSNAFANFDWSYKGLHEAKDFHQFIEMERIESGKSIDQEIILGGVKEDAGIYHKLLNDGDVPSRIENFAFLEGSTRFYMGEIFLVSSRYTTQNPLELLSLYTREHLFENIRIGLGHVFTRTSNSKIYYAISFFYPIPNNFGA